MKFTFFIFFAAANALQRTDQQRDVLPADHSADQLPGETVPGVCIEQLATADNNQIVDDRRRNVFCVPMSSMKEALAAAESELTEQGLSRQKRVIPVIAGIAVTSTHVIAGATVVGAGATTVGAGATAYMASQCG